MRVRIDSERAQPLRRWWRAFTTTFQRLMQKGGSAEGVAPRLTSPNAVCRRKFVLDKALNFYRQPQHIQHIQHIRIYTIFNICIIYCIYSIYNKYSIYSICTPYTTYTTYAIYKHMQNINHIQRWGVQHAKPEPSVLEGPGNDLLIARKQNQVKKKQNLNKT